VAVVTNALAKRVVMADNVGIAASATTMPSNSKPAACPCGGPSLQTCCGPYLAGDAVPDDAETLMRSRYTAYTLGNEDYLRATWHPSTRPREALIDPKERLQWIALEVKSALRLRQRKAELSESPDADSVEFVARFKINGRAHRLHELSRFVRETVDGVPRWFYLDGSFPE
jgi:SEC-C motif-containing protein